MNKLDVALMNGRIFEFNSGARYPEELLEASDLESLGALMVSDFGVWRPSDVGLCFGNPDFYESIAETAASLYHQDMFPVIVVSGSVPIRGGSQPEALAMRDTLLEHNVPETSILVESSSTNSKENIVCSKALLNKQLPDFDVSSVLGIGRKSSAYRFVGTLTQNWGEVDAAFKGAVDFSDVTPSNWFKHNLAAEHIWSEVNKVIEYAGKGDVCSDFSRVLRQFCERLKDAGGVSQDQIRGVVASLPPKL